MNITTILIILFAHWVADFVCQTDNMAQGKSKNLGDLLTHTAVYSLVIGIIVGVTYIMSQGDSSEMFYTFDRNFGLKFTGITFIAHTITDYFTSRLNSKLWAEKKVHWFFVSIGFDQYLHYFQLILTYYLLSK